MFALSGPALADSSPSLCSAANVGAILSASERDTLIDLPTFYETIQEAFPVYANSGLHYEGTDAILNEWNARRELKDPRWLAYILATAYHETAQRMFPIRETLASTDESAVNRLANSSCCGHHTYWREHDPTGEHYFGRGYVQLTWYYNYQRVDDEFAISYDEETEDSYYWNPSLALDPVTSIRITYDGMIHGWFVPGHCLLRHFRSNDQGEPNQAGDWLDARRIINGRDRDALIAEHADAFLTAIEAATIPASAVVDTPPADPPPDEPDTPPAPDDDQPVTPPADDTDDADAPVAGEDDHVPDQYVHWGLLGLGGLGGLLLIGNVAGRAFRSGGS